MSTHNDNYNFVPSRLFDNNLTNNNIFYVDRFGYLKFVPDFNKPINNEIISIIKNNQSKMIKFGVNFNKPVENLKELDPELNEGKIFIEYLSFGYYFNQELDNLPNGIRFLELDINFSKSLTTLPDSLISLRYQSEYPLNFELLPLNLKKLDLTNSNINYKIKNFPVNLEHLILPKNYNESLSDIPIKLKYIKFGQNFNKSIDNLIQINHESSLQIIDLSSSDFDYPINNLPVNLKVLILGNKFNQVLDYLPEGILLLSTGNSFIHPLDKLPEGLEVLIIGNNFNNTLNNLPSSLQELVLNSYVFNESVYNLPTNIKKFYIHSKSTIKNQLKNINCLIEYLPVTKVLKNYVYNLSKLDINIELIEDGINDIKIVL